MKLLLSSLLFLFASLSLADQSCTATIKDGFSSRESFTRFSYSREAACSEARYECERRLSDYQSRGMYRFAFCEVELSQYPDYPRYPDYPTDPRFPDYPRDPRDPRYPDYPRSFQCQTDLVDYYGRIIRTFTGEGRDFYSACNESDRFCSDILSRGNSRGERCVRSGRGNGGGNYPRPTDPWITAECRVQRLDPAGYLVQEYFEVKSGPRSSNPRIEACRAAERQCSYDLRGRQTCRTL